MFIVGKQLDKNVKVNFKVYDIPDWQTIIIHILPNISKSKDNQPMKFGQLIECNLRNIFLQNHAENEAERLVPDFFLKKALYKVKASGLHLSFHIFC